MTPQQNVQNVAQGGRLRRSHNPDPARQRGDRLLARGVKQPFRFQLGLELLERDLQRARALGLKILGGNLQFAAIFVDGDSPAQHHLHAIFRDESAAAAPASETSRRESANSGPSG